MSAFVPVSSFAGARPHAGTKSEAVCGASPVAATPVRNARRVSKNAQRANTRMAVVEENLAWVDGISIADIEPGKSQSQILAGLDILIVCANDGQVYAISNKGTPLGVPIVGGKTVDIDGVSYLKCPQYGTLFNLATGEVKDKDNWLVSPPVVKNILRFLFPDPIPLEVYPVRQEGDMIQVLLNVNARAMYEQKYWKGILDASGKADGGYY